MSLPNGLYNLRASPAGGLGGLYATAQGPNHIVTVAPHTPPFFERQVWKIEAVNGEEGLYTITGSAFGGHWHVTDREPIDEKPVITSRESFEWYISPLDNGGPDTITIRAPTPLIGVTLYAGTNDENQVIIKPVAVAPGEEAPYWQFKVIQLD